ncbi:glycosyltransferase family 2 protein [Williamsia sp.]|uniref:glycosyltransferase family 2 protein n=1 Tax=Williamsia sp. TaxID=1872085 RepID=UPI002F928926
MHTTPTTVSVVIPIYNSRDYLQGCLDSLLAQTRRVDQIVLVDDCGHDDSIAFACTHLTARGAEHTVVTHPENRGLGCARNSGLAAATGDLIWFLDSDDRADPTFIEVLTDALDRHDADFACTRTRRVDENNNDLGVDEPLYGTASMSGKDFAHLLIRGGAKAYACNKIFRRQILDDRTWDEDQSYEDFAPLVRLGLRAERVALVDEPLYWYLYRPGSISTHFSSRTFDLFKVADDVMTEVAAHDLEPSWQADLRGFRYREILTSVAHLAMRADHATPSRPAQYTAAINRVRASIRLSDVPKLIRTGFGKEAVFAVLMKASPRLYSTILRYR